MFNYLVSVFTTAVAAALFLWVWPWGLVFLLVVSTLIVAAVLAKS